MTEVAAPYIYNAEWEHGFRVYDMTLPPNSAPVGELSIPQNQFYSSGLSSLGSLVALSSSDDASLREVKIISVADPSDPFIMGQVDVPAPPHRSIISGGFVFVCLGDAGVSIIDISTCQQACYADCDESGALTIFDYICFGNAYAGNEPYADCDNSGSLNVFDYICYGNAYAAGCP